MKIWSNLLIVFAMLLSACANAGNNNNNMGKEVVPTRSDAAVEPLTPTSGAPLEGTAGSAATDLLATPQAVEASTLAANINNTEVAGQSGRVGQVLGIVMDAAFGRARYLVVRTLGLEVEKTALLPMGAYQIALLAPDQADETGGSMLPVVWLTVPDSDLAAAPEIDPGIFTETGQLLGEWDQESSQYWASLVTEMPVTGEEDGGLSQENLLYLSGSLLEDFNLTVMDAQGKAIGEILDFVVDSSGKVTFAALRPSGLEDGFDEEVAVPASRLTWDASQRAYTGNFTADELRDAPRFDRSDLPDMTIPGWEMAWDAYWGQKTTGSQSTPEKAVGQQVKISHLLGMQVLDVTSTALGEVEDMILGQNGSIQYLVVRSGNQHRPVPWMVFDFTEGILTYLDDVARLEEAPGFASLEAIDPINPQWDEQIRGYWGLSR